MSSKTLSAVLQKRIRRLCLNDFPCGPVNWVSFLFVLFVSAVNWLQCFLDYLNWWTDYFLQKKKEKKLSRQSRHRGHRRPPGSAEVPSLSVEVWSIMEPSSSGSERAGCAHTWTPEWSLHLQLLYYTSYCGQRRECLILFLFPNPKCYILNLI